MTGCTPVPSERRKWFQRKKDRVFQVSIRLVPSLALVKILLKSPSAEALLNLLGRNWSRKKPAGVEVRPGSGVCAGAAGCSVPCRVPALPAELPGRWCGASGRALAIPGCHLLWTPTKVLKRLPAELCFPCRGLYLTIFLLHQHQPS